MGRLMATATYTGESYDGDLLPKPPVATPEHLITIEQDDDPELGGVAFKAFCRCEDLADGEWHLVSTYARRPQWYGMRSDVNSTPEQDAYNAAAADGEAHIEGTQDQEA